LKYVKHGSKGRFGKKFNNKLSRWSYSQCLAKLQSVCEVQGIDFVRVNPAYTSQTCSLCGHVDRASRMGEAYCCTRCGMKMDADVNAAKNILMRGAYSPPPVRKAKEDFQALYSIRRDRTRLLRTQ
jgi:putative transposase